MKRILLATDGSEYAEEAARFVHRLSRVEPLEVIVLNVVVAPHKYRATMRSDWIETCVAQDRERAPELLAKLESLLSAPNIAVRSLVKEGHAGALIVEVADDEECDLVVLGARGHSAVSRILLGSTSDYVATHARCSALVVRPTALQRRAQPFRIGIGYEETDVAQSALEEIRGLRWPQDAEFHIVTVSYLPQPFAATWSEGARGAAEREAGKFRQSGYTAEAHLIENDHLGEGLVQYAEDHQCELFVVGETPRGPIERFLMGSGSRFVLRHAPCSVWIARSHAAHRAAAPARTAAAGR